MSLITSPVVRSYHCRLRGSVASPNWTRRLPDRSSGSEGRLDLAHDGALMPAPQHEVRNERQREEDDDAGEREEDERREHARDVETVARFDDAIGKPRAGAGRAGCDLWNHRADQRDPAGDL